MLYFTISFYKNRTININNFHFKIFFFMVSNTQLTKIKNWYNDFAESFYTSDEDFNDNIKIKIDHTLRVCKEIKDIGESLRLSGEQLQIAEVIALLHDVGRFEQMAKYKTSVDILSEDHARLSVKIINDNDILRYFDDFTREIMKCSIANHNKMEIPAELSDECLLFTRLLRDADKIDIWYVVTEYYKNKGSTKNEYIELGLPDKPEISDEVCRDLLEGSIVRTVNLQSLNDMKLLQLGWVYDINFRRSFQIIREREYIKKIYAVLPHTEVVNKIYEKIGAYLDNKSHVNRKHPAQ